jgi:hypothetical protein
MIGTLIGVIFLVVICGALWWAFNKLIGLIPLEEPFKTILYVILVLIGVAIVLVAIQMVLGAFGVHVPWPQMTHLRSALELANFA